VRTCFSFTFVGVCFYLLLRTTTENQLESPHQIQISIRPNITGYIQFFTAKETKMIRNVWEKFKANSSRTAVVLKNGTAGILGHTVRSSILRFNKKILQQLDPSTFELVRRAVERMTIIAGVPSNKAEALAFLHYTPGQYFAAHIDAHSLSGMGTSRRIATFYTIIIDEFEGGETFFPLGTRIDGSFDPLPKSCEGFEQKNPERQNNEADAYLDGSEGKNIDPRNRGISIRVKAGSAIIWGNLADGVADPYSRHAGCPLLSGEKLALVAWIHEA